MAEWVSTFSYLGWKVDVFLNGGIATTTQSRKRFYTFSILNNGNKQISHVLLEVVAKDYEFSDESLNYVLANAGSFLRAR